ncbi:MAG: Type 1 glutamine amidotransferase-like domain-containing protein [Chloroflexota bacterium]
MTDNKLMGYVPNACDYTNVDLNRRNEVNRNDMSELSKLGLEVEILDLKDYFGQTDKLRKKIKGLGGIFIRGGNTFILRQAMRLSGFETIFKELQKRESFVYSGYSAGICVLAPDLKAIRIVDDPTDNPYKELQDTIWEGLGYLDYLILPHYKSDHPESAAVDKTMEFCIKNKIPFKTLKDGEVIILE